MRWCPLCTNRLKWVFLVLAHLNSSARIDISLHFYTFSRFCANQSLLFLLNDACLAEKQQLLFLWPTRYNVWDLSEKSEPSLTWRTSYNRQELFTLPEHMISPSVFSGIPVMRSLVLCLCFVGRCFSCYPFSFGHCVVCPSIYGLWLPLCSLQTLLLTPWLFLWGLCIVLCFIFALFVFVLCCACPMLPVSLDCQFLIAPFNCL